MVIGLARSVRSESILKFVTLDLDHRPIFNVHADSAAIMDVMRAIWMAKPPAKDMEYTEREGRLLVPRIVNDVDMNNYVHRETQDATAYLQPFSQPGRPLKLKVGIPGALDTLHFVDDLGYQQPLEPNEVSLRAFLSPRAFPIHLHVDSMASSKPIVFRNGNISIRS